MSPKPIDPLSELRQLRNIVNEFFEDNILRRGLEPLGATSGWSPRSDFFEEDGTLVLCIELPGFSAKDVQAELRDHRLILSGAPSAPPPHAENFYRMERYRSPFRRAFNLPNGLEYDAPSIEMQNGVLTVRISLRRRT